MTLALEACLDLKGLLELVNDLHIAYEKEKLKYELVVDLQECQYNFRIGSACFMLRSKIL